MTALVRRWNEICNFWSPERFFLLVFEYEAFSISRLGLQNFVARIVAITSKRIWYMSAGSRFRAPSASKAQVRLCYTCQSSVASETSVLRPTRFFPPSPNLTFLKNSFWQNLCLSPLSVGNICSRDFFERSFLLERCSYVMQMFS